VKKILLSSTPSTPEVSGNQLSPPFVVFKIVAGVPPPAIHPIFESLK